MVLNAHADLQKAMYACLFGDDDSKKKGKEALPGAVAPTLDGLERVLARSTNEGPFFFSESGPTLADLAVYNVFESPFPGLKALGIDASKYPKLNDVIAAVQKDPKVGDYMRKMSMGKPELVYFDGPGRGQLPRLAFAAASVEFTDTRIKQDEWPAVKADPESIPGKCFGS